MFSFVMFWSLSPTLGFLNFPNIFRWSPYAKLWGEKKLLLTLQSALGTENRHRSNIPVSYMQTTFTLPLLRPHVILVELILTLQYLTKLQTRYNVCSDQNKDKCRLLKQSWTQILEKKLKKNGLSLEADIEKQIYRWGNLTWTRWWNIKPTGTTWVDRNIPADIIEPKEGKILKGIRITGAAKWHKNDLREKAAQKLTKRRKVKKTEEIWKRNIKRR